MMLFIIEPWPGGRFLEQFEDVERVWRHFLFEGLQPYVESGAHREKPGG